MIRFMSREYLILLWLLPALFLGWIWMGRRVRQSLSTFFGPRLSRFLTASASASLQKWHLFLRLGALGFFILALARPQMGMSLQQVKLQGIEIVIALDVSNSMLVEDIKPSRLEYAKIEISKLIDRLNGDRVGMIAFAGSAVLLSPITTDMSALKMFVDSVSTESVQRQGTDIAKALKEARAAFDRGGIESDDVHRTTRAILVLTDGEDHEKGALDEASQLAKEGTRVFVVAVGTERGGPIPVRDERGYLKAYKRDGSGQNIMSTLNSKFLQELANTGKGTFTFINGTGEEVVALKSAIDQLEKTEFDSTVQTNYDEKYQIPLAIGLTLLLIDLLLGDRRLRAGLWRGRFETMAAMALPMLFFFPLPSIADELSAVLKNNEGRRLFSAEKWSEAQDKFTDALAEAPDRGELHVNVGTTFLYKKDFDKALSEFDIALKSKLDDEVKFKALFNAAIAAGAKGNIDQSLNYYQQALALQPHSKEVKTNIELMFSGGKGKKEGDQSEGNSGDQQGQPQQPKPGQKPTPKPFKSEELTQRDVEKMMEELKRQEEQVRAKMERDGRKEAPGGKDW